MPNLTAFSWLSLLLWLGGLALAVHFGHALRKKPRNLMGNLTPYLVISGLVLALSIGSLWHKGLNYGLDFTGGTLLEIGMPKMVTSDDVQAALADFKQPELGDRMIQVGANFSKDEADKDYQRVVVRVTRAQPSPEGGRNLVDQEPKALLSHLKSKLGEFKELGSTSIGPTITGELRYHALLALIVAMAVQASYIFVRFGFQWRYGIAADIAIIHDVVIMVGLYSLAGRQLDSPFVAALLTVAGYSIMDSVVIFDRIRENEHYFRGNKPFPEVVNISVNQTMSRSVNTTLTVLITLIAIYFFGGSSLENFAFALLCGITSGAYSSVFVAAPALVLIDRFFKSKPKAASTYHDRDPLDDEPVYREGGSAASVAAAAEGAAPARRRVRGARRKL